MNSNRIFQFFFFYIYRFLFMPLTLSFVFLFLWPVHKKIKQGLKLRQTKKLKNTFSQRPIWIHASSGEFEYAKPIITALKKWRPEVPIVVTYFSPSYAEQIQKFPGVDLSLPLPFDLRGPTRDFIRRLNPEVLLVARTDLWPELLFSVRELGRPALLFSCTFRPLKGLRALIKPYYRMLFDQFSEIFAVTQDDLANIKASRTEATLSAGGDTRYDQVLHRLQNPKPLRDELFNSLQTPILIAGSTWSEDETEILSATSELVKANQLKLILVPHEPSQEHIARLQSLVQKHGLTHARYSTAPLFDSHVLIVDQTGLLAELYSRSQFAFVGGSFKRKVHSVMESLGAGLPTFVGPYHHNNREALEFQKINISSNLSAVTAVQNSGQLKRHLQQILTSIDSLKASRALIRDEVKKRTGGSTRVLNWVIQHYERPHPGEMR